MISKVDLGGKAMTAVRGRRKGAIKVYLQPFVPCRNS